MTKKIKLDERTNLLGKVKDTHLTESLLKVWKECLSVESEQSNQDLGAVSSMLKA